MKKLITVAALAVLALGLAGCGSTNPDIYTKGAHLTFSGGKTYTFWTLKTNHRPEKLYVLVDTEEKNRLTGAWFRIGRKIIDRSNIPAVGHSKNYQYESQCASHTLGTRTHPRVRRRPHREVLQSPLVRAERPPGDQDRNVRPVNHAQLQAGIVALAAELGLHCHHCPMLTSSPGWPDLVIVGDRGVLWRELKVPPDRLTSEQRALGYRLKAAGQDWRVWWPVDWHAGTIECELRQLAQSTILGSGNG